MSGRHRGFTLVELLVVIAIIGLLVAILLPSLRGARQVARLSQSLSNCRQLLLGMSAYRTDHRDWLPMMILENGSGTIGWSTWAYGGKASHVDWRTRDSGIFDTPPGIRPLNPYVYPTTSLPTTVTDAASRALPELEAFRSPGDRFSYQFEPPFPTPHRTRSSYNDVGTSYHNNMKWWDKLKTAMDADPAQRQRSGESTLAYWRRVMGVGIRRINSGTDFDISKLVWIHDQTGDIVAHDPQRRNWLGEFGDRNRSVMAFIDGHADYITMVPGAESGPRYIFHFPLRNGR